MKQRTAKENQAGKWLACLLLVLVLPLNAWAAERYALLIGMELYEEYSPTNKFPPLNRSINDVKAVKAALKAIGGYHIVEILDQNNAVTVKAIKTFIKNLPANSKVLVFYSGHGVMVENDAYLMPISGYSTGQDVKSWGVSLSWLQGSIQEKDPQSLILVLDTCRIHIPLYAAKGEDESFVASSPASQNTLIAYATTPGYYSYEGNNNALTSDYTRIFVSSLQDPANWTVPAYQLFYDVAVTVASETNNK
jgi:uncharacterized caspase-like protein